MLHDTLRDLCKIADKHCKSFTLSSRSSWLCALHLQSGRADEHAVTNCQQTAGITRSLNLPIRVNCTIRCQICRFVRFTFRCDRDCLIGVSGVVAHSKAGFRGSALLQLSSPAPSKWCVPAAWASCQEAVNRVLPSSAMSDIENDSAAANLLCDSGMPHGPSPDKPALKKVDCCTVLPARL